MQLSNGRVLYSATDLIDFLACDFLTVLQLRAAEGKALRPPRGEGETAIRARLGDQHEREYLNLLAERGLDIAKIDKDLSLLEASQATLNAMRLGRDIIYQATFLDGDWMGRADFLRKVANTPQGGESRWPWHYEVEDAKLARHTEPYFLLQLCYYSDHVARLQGLEPEHMYVILGDKSVHRFRYLEFAAYYRDVRRLFLEAIAQKGSPYPLPVKHCKICAWKDVCEERWRRDDHLTLLANVTRLQIQRLTEAGITTLAQLAASSTNQCPSTMDTSTFEKLGRQARLQVSQRLADELGTGPIEPEFLPHTPTEWLDKGFALLPPPSNYDVFFDMEGDPYYGLDASLEYLFGFYTPDNDHYESFWGCDDRAHGENDRLAEKFAFERFIDFVLARYRQHPEMHVYHYGSYEKTKLQELSQRHATRENEIDLILREQILVDLYSVVRQSIVVGQPGYSIKDLEVYFGKRDESLSIKTGGDSVLRFEQWLAERAADATGDSILLELRAYNQFDCISTYRLREWLLSLREMLARQSGIEVPFAAKRADEEPSSVGRDIYRDLKDRLAAQIPGDFDPEQDDPGFSDVRPMWLALQMLEYHWREVKPMFWLFHDRCETYHENPNDLLDDSESLVGLRFVERTSEGARGSVRERYHFPLQEFKLEDGDCFAPHDKNLVGQIHSISNGDEIGTLILHRAPRHLKHEIRDAIVVRKMVPAGAVRDALARFSESLLEGNVDKKYSAAYDILTRARTRTLGARASSLQPEAPEEATVQPIIDSLDNSYLFIQGPPGSGKTFIGARLLVNLIERGKRVGISANSHKAIHNLLDEIEHVAHERNVRFSGARQIVAGNTESEYASVRGCIQNVGKFDDAPAAQLYAGTAWALCKSMAFADQPLDYLFIDEAGQVALPHAIAMSTTASNVVLLGDPLQLAQVSHASHPGGVGRSVLLHILGEELRPISPDRGVLLTKSYRMNKPICEFISSLMYEGRLSPARGRELQSVQSPGITGRGLRFIEVHHENNRQSSEEEAAAIVHEVELLLRGTVTDHEGKTSRLFASDIIVVTPYNAQVKCIRRALQRRGAEYAGIEVGTVDKFQGREAHVVFLSMAASTIEDAPRGIGFLLDRNRFNVAISRARSVAVLVASPKILIGKCTTVEHARLMNCALRFKELSDLCPYGDPRV